MIALGVGYYDTIDFAAENGAQTFLGLRQPRPGILGFLIGGGSEFDSRHDGSGICGSCARGRTWSPTRTRSVFKKSPMILRIGAGSLRITVGTATIRSPAASCGFLRRS